MLVAGLVALLVPDVAAQDIFAVDPTLRTTLRTRTEWSYNNVHSLPDGKLIVCGSFRYVDGVAANWLARLLPDGRLDPSFTSPAPQNRVLGVGSIGDGRLIINALRPSSPGAGAQLLIERLHPDGSIDPAFTAFNLLGSFPVAVVGLPDGGAYVVVRTGVGVRVIRLLADGQADGSFASASIAGNFASAAILGPASQLLLVRISGVGPASVVVVANDGTVAAPFAGIPGNFRASGAAYEPSGAVVLTGATVSPTPGPSLIRLWPNGTRDLSFDGTLPFSNNAGSAIARLADGSYLVTGPGPSLLPAVLRFSSTGAYLGGLASTTIDGTLGISGVVAAPSGGYAYGRFSSLGGTTAPSVARIAADGSVDAAYFADITGAGTIATIAPYRDGFLFAGAFSEVGDQDIYNVATVGADGEFAGLVPYFPPGVQRSLATSDGGVVLLGSIGPPIASPVGALKVRPDGTLSFPFIPHIPQHTVEDAVEQPDGRMVFAGRTGAGVPGSQVLNLFRTNANGTLDPAFNQISPLTGGNGSGLTAVGVDAVGRIVVGGSFTTIQGVARSGLARLTSAGLIDPTFVPAVGLNTRVPPRHIRFLPDGSLCLIGVVGTQPPFIRRLIRFNEDGSLHESQLDLGDFAVMSSVCIRTARLSWSVSRRRVPQCCACFRTELLIRCLSCGSMLVPPCRCKLTARGV